MSSSKSGVKLFLLATFLLPPVFPIRFHSCSATQSLLFAESPAPACWAFSTGCTLQSGAGRLPARTPQLPRQSRNLRVNFLSLVLECLQRKFEETLPVTCHFFILSCSVSGWVPRSQLRSAQGFAAIRCPGGSIIYIAASHITAPKEQKPLIVPSPLPINEPYRKNLKIRKRIISFGSLCAGAASQTEKRSVYTNTGEGTVCYSAPAHHASIQLCWFWV